LTAYRAKILCLGADTSNSADQGADIVAIFSQMARVRNLQRQQL